jgi:hypothetical protein
MSSGNNQCGLGCFLVGSLGLAFFVAVVAGVRGNPDRAVHVRAEVYDEVTLWRTRGKTG